MLPPFCMGIITQMNTYINTSEQYFISHLNGNINVQGGLGMDTNARIRQLMDERRWTEYKLAKAANLSQSTIANLFNRNTVPSISTLEAICSAFGITLAQFFAEGDMVELSKEKQEMFRQWVSLTDEQKELLYGLIRNMKQPKG